ncbi:hypothetical protein MSG28_006727 [Choristoneura fumiferana]|uniref:Uncharacterized protein n=1 Tax=Choristoneura fumiferana TaxID=7141 RepID=A0ACC0JLR1_CHOFU|nr:hypothetical protein MSG28_006727 [Choristoneura fumiferana]
MTMEIENVVNVKLLFFAQSKELAGTKESSILLPKKLSYNQLLNIITESYNLQAIKNNILLAKNEEVCDEAIDIEINELDMDHLQLTADKLSVDAISELVVDDSCGAVSIFVGTTRDNFDGKKVLRLEYEAYEPMALKAMKAICTEIRDKWPAVHGIAIYHRLGNVPCREASVVIAVSSPHRRESLDAVSLCIDLLKAKVPVWKREVYADAAPAWKENVECAWSIDHIDKSLIQINVSDEELQQRIQNFIERKREQVNISNIHDFIPGKEDDQTEDTCARVCNEWGPQTVSDFSQPEPAASGLPASGVPTASGLPAAIAERVLSVEKFLNIGPKSQKEPDEPEQKPAMNFIFSAEDIARKIEQLERMDSM